MSTAPATSIKKEIGSDDTTSTPSVIDKDVASSGSGTSPTINDGATNSNLAQAWLDRALNYFSHASNESLCLSFVGLGVSTYLILGRVGLVLMGVVGGVAIHAAWEGESSGLALGCNPREAVLRKRREIGLDIVKRVWAWSENGKSREEKPTEDIQSLSKAAGYDHFQPETAEALKDLTKAIITTNVRSWYHPLVPDDELFPMSCHKTLSAFIRSLSAHLSYKRPTNMFLDLVTNSTSIIVVFLSELAIALNASPQIEPSAAVETYLDKNPESSLARMLETSQQQKKLDVISEDVLSNFLDPKVYDCPPVNAFLSRIVSRSVLASVLDKCSQPEWINEWIVYFLEDSSSSGLGRDLDLGTDTVDRLGQKRGLEQSDATSTRRENIDRAEDAMEEAMREAKRLTQLIVEEEARKQQQGTPPQNISIPRPESASNTPPRSPLSASPLNASDVGPHDTPRAPARAGLSRTVSSASNPRHRVMRTASGNTVPTASTSDNPDEPRPAPTLANAKISIFDDSVNGDMGKVKNKPTIDYLIQIEPANSALPGWMTARRYADFENLHEVLRRIATITGVSFADKHPALPPWKGQIKTNLRGDLEQYLGDALKHQPLADSEGMKRFLDKDQSHLKSPDQKGLGWPPAPEMFNTMGKNMIGALTKAPKNVAGGGKALIDGVSNVLVGGEKRSSTPRSARNSLAAAPSGSVYSNGADAARLSQDSFSRQSFESSAARGSLDITSGSRQSANYSDSDTRPSTSSSNRNGVTNGYATLDGTADYFPSPPSSGKKPSIDSRPSIDGRVSRNSTNVSRSTSMTNVIKAAGSTASSSVVLENGLPLRPSTPKTKTNISVLSQQQQQVASQQASQQEAQQQQQQQTPSRKVNAALNEQETQVTIELVFAVITELYTLSSAWNFRRTLLTAAKTFLLRPGNPQLEAIRVMIQETVIDQNCSDKGLAALINKLRQNAAPTTDELAAWPNPLTPREKEDLRVKARAMLVERGMPQALMSVMGAAASGEALGKIFDCLQMEHVARSLVFGILLQALRATVQ